MQTYFIPATQTDETDRLILFFNGWAMDRNAVQHLKKKDTDALLLVEDYREDTLTFDFSPYKEIILIAWSMGVWATERLFHLQQLPRIKKAIAIGGTPLQRDDSYGIPSAIFDGTLENLNEENRQRFNRRMCGGKRLKHIMESLEKRSTEAIKAELKRVKDTPLPSFSTRNSNPLFYWSKAIIPLKDRIVPAQNQINYWTDRGIDIQTLEDKDHYIFDSFTSWLEIIDL